MADTASGDGIVRGFRSRTANGDEIARGIRSRTPHPISNGYNFQHSN
jgi:hypothetical protein